MLPLLLQWHFSCPRPAGCRIAQNMSWDVVVNTYLLPSLKKILLKDSNRKTATKLASQVAQSPQF